MIAWSLELWGKSDYLYVTVCDALAKSWMSFLGTCRWQAPEFFDNEIGQGHTTASDVYSFACSCYEVKDFYWLSIGLTTALYLQQIFSGNIPFYKIHLGAAVIFRVIRGERPSRPPIDICHSRGLDDDMWGLINSCWTMKPAERLTASEIVNRLQSRSALSVEERPHHNWDMAFPSLLRSSLEEIPLFPSDDYVEAALFCHDSMACKILSWIGCSTSGSYLSLSVPVWIADNFDSKGVSIAKTGKTGEVYQSMWFWLDLFVIGTFDKIRTAERVPVPVATNLNRDSESLSLKSTLISTSYERVSNLNHLLTILRPRIGDI